MLIRIMYRDGRFDMVKSFFLDWLIESGRIVKFQRADGWVIPGRHPVRSPGNAFYGGRDRRTQAEPPLIVILALALKHETNLQVRYVNRRNE